tara:strand:+ start:403 stop:504 length:102 start_codon:yes stop_codon:yes gene_type:complete
MICLILSVGILAILVGVTFEAVVLPLLADWLGD